MYDTIIIGAGPAGMTAAIYAARTNLKVAILDSGLPGGQMNNTLDITNYPGYFHIEGPKLSENMYEQVIELGVEHVFEHVNTIEKEDDTFNITTESGSTFTAKTVIIATGAKHRHLDVPGELELASRGVSYCAVCDGVFFKDKDIIVVGGGDSAVEEALYLTNYTSKVTIVHRRDELRAQAILQQKAFDHPKIFFMWNSTVDEILGDERVTGVRLTQNNGSTHIDCDGVFIYVGLDPVNNFNLPIDTDGGWIITDNNMSTNIPGLFAIGDIRKKDLRQITTAVGDGAIAGQSVYNFLQR